MAKGGSRSLERGRGKKAFLYRQLSAILRKRIDKGEYAPGDRLPSMDDLSREYHLNKVTVRSALAELTAEGLVYSVPAQGTFVAKEGAARAAVLPETGTTVRSARLSATIASAVPADGARWASPSRRPPLANSVPSRSV